MAPRLVSDMTCGVGIWPWRMLSQLYLALLAQRMLLLRAHIKFSGNAILLNVSFVRLAQDVKVNAFVSFYRLLYSVRLRREGIDRLWLIPFKRGLFGVKSFYNVLVCLDGIRFPWKNVWMTKVSLRAAFFVWSTALGKILTLDNLYKRNVIVMDWYIMCKRNWESTDHLLLHCEVACTMWNVFFKHYGLSWVMPRRVVNVFACWWTAGSTLSAVV